MLKQRAVYAVEISFARAWKRILGRIARRNAKRIGTASNGIAGGDEQEERQSGAHLALGVRGERLAIEYLQRRGYRIVATNFTAPIGRRRDGRAVTGEIDIIAYDATTDPPTLAFIEVKTRSSDAVAAPAAAVDRRKQRRIVRTARLYRRLLRLGETVMTTDFRHREGDPRPPAHPYRYDVVGIVAAPGRAARIELHRGFFDEEIFGRSRWLRPEE